MPKLSQSAQARWSRRKKAAGCCARCGQRRNQYKHLCDRCQGLKAAYMRRYRAAKKAALKMVADEILHPKSVSRPAEMATAFPATLGGIPVDN